MPRLVLSTKEVKIKDVSFFSGRYDFLSNFSPAPVYIMVGKLWVKCATVEHAYQASKTLDMRWRSKIIDAPTPGAAKRIGWKVEKVIYWEEVKTVVMLELLRQKFTRAKMRTSLLATKDMPLIEGNNWHDNFWGQCFCGCGEDRSGNKIGENMLGRLLERVRTDVRRGEKYSHKRVR